MRLQSHGTLLFSIVKSPSGTFLVPGIFRIDKSNFGNLFWVNLKLGVATFLYSTTASRVEGNILENSDYKFNDSSPSS